MANWQKPGMIATLEGIIQSRGPDWVVVSVGGIGFQVYSSSLTLNQLAADEGKISLYTLLYVKEDNISLFGFISPEELTLFKDLISVQGVGPKVALALLSSLKVEQLAKAIVDGDVDFIRQVPGVGKKTAGRIAIELRDKLEYLQGWSALPLPQEYNDVIVALTSLGYSAREATKAVSTLADSSELSLEEKIRMALQQLATR